MVLIENGLRWYVVDSDKESARCDGTLAESRLKKPLGPRAGCHSCTGNDRSVSGGATPCACAAGATNQVATMATRAASGVQEDGLRTGTPNREVAGRRIVIRDRARE